MSRQSPKVRETRDDRARRLGYDPLDLPIEPLPRAMAKLFPITRDVDIPLGFTQEKINAAK